MAAPTRYAYAARVTTPSRAMDHASIEAVAELTLRLARVMHSDYVVTWLRTNVEALGGERPIDLIASGDLAAVSRLISGLESSGAA